jgi:hypothetical protein
VFLVKSSYCYDIHTNVPFLLKREKNSYLYEMVQLAFFRTKRKPLAKSQNATRMVMRTAFGCFETKKIVGVVLFLNVQISWKFLRVFKVGYLSRKMKKKLCSFSFFRTFYDLIT